MGILLAYMVLHMHSWCPERPEEGAGATFIRVTDCFKASVWVLGIDPRSSVGAASALNHRVTTPDP